jgi:hypothetical protein
VERGLGNGTVNQRLCLRMMNEEKGLKKRCVAKQKYEN